MTPSDAIDADPQSFVSKFYFAINKKKNYKAVTPKYQIANKKETG